MSTSFQFLAERAGVLLVAATCLLAVGCVGVALQRSPIHRQRAGEVAILGVLIWLFLACVPLPRYRLPDFWPADRVVQDSVRPAEQVAIPPPVFDPQDEAILAEVFTEEEVAPMQIDVLPSEVGAAAEDGDATVLVLPPVPDSVTAVEPERLPSAQVVQPPAEADRATATLGRWASVAPAVDVRYLLAIAYVAGALGCVVWLAFGRVLLVRMVGSARPPEPWVGEVYRGIAFGRRRRPRLLISDRCGRALSFGIWRPAIVLPGDACRTDRVEALRYVLSHELAHVRQRDGWGHLLFNVAFPLLYFHPMYWWLRSRAYLAAELIADDWAAGRRTKESYVEALVALAKRGGHVQLAYSSSPQILGSRSQFYRRMQMLLDRDTRLARRCSPLWRVIYPAACLLAVVLVAGAAGVRPAEAQPEAAPPDAEEVVVEAVVAGEDVPKPPAPTDPDLIEVDPIAEKGVEDAEQVEIFLADELSEAEVSQLTQDRNALQAERDQLRAQLKALEASLKDLREMVETLNTQRTASQPVTGKALPRTSPTQSSEEQRPVPVVVAVRVDAATAAKVRPGDRVDAIFPSGDGTRVLHDLPVAGAAHNATIKEGTVWLQVSPELANVLIRAAARATIGLRSRKPQPQPPMTPPFEPKLEPPPSSFPIASSRAYNATSAGRRYDPFGAVTDRRVPEGTRLDLVRLATSYADVVGELEIAKLELEGRKELADRNAVPKQELAIAEIKFDTAQRKLAVLRKIAESAMVATEAEMGAAKGRLDWVSKNSPDDERALVAAKSEIIGAESRMRILRSILESAGR